MSLRRKILYALTALVVAVLLVLPLTGWIARLQLMPWSYPGLVSLLSGSVAGDKKSYDRMEADAARRAPGDYDLQFARAMGACSPTDMSPLESLNARYPHRPEVLAALLSRMTQEQVHIKRVEPNILSVQTPDRDAKKPQNELIALAVWTKFDALAADGEASDPDNAYFPTLRSFGAFVAGRDAVAVAAWERAADKPRFDEYAWRGVAARWKMHRAVFGTVETGFLARLAVSAAPSFPEYAQMRNAARMMTVEAVNAELAGDRERGVALRRATRRVGETMASRSKSYIGNLVGMALVQIAEGRPGGAPPWQGTRRGTEGWKQDTKERQAAFVAYLRSIGHADEAAVFETAIAQNDLAKPFLTQAEDHSYMAFGAKTYSLFADWYGDVLLLAGMLFALVFAGVFALVYRFSPRMQRNEPLQASARWGVSVAFGLTVLYVGAASAVLAGGVSPDVAVGAAFLVGAVAIALPPFLMRLSLKQAGHGVLVMGATLVVIALIVGIGALGVVLSFGVVTGIGMQSIVGTGGDGQAHRSLASTLGILLPFLIGGALMLLPVVLLALFALFSRILGIPVAAGVTRGARSLGVPLACALLLGWACCLVATANREHAALRELDRVQEIGEMQTYAEILGKPMPVKGN